MDNAIDWQKLSDKERTRLLLQYVTLHFVLDTTATGWNTAEHPRGKEAVAIGFRYPIAFWNTDAECWAIRDIATDPVLFDPMHDMNDCMKMLVRFEQWELDYKDRGVSHPSVPRPYEAYIWDLGKRYRAHADTPQEAICKAALMAVGTEII